MERVTFHTDYTYAQFVGAYKPVSDAEGKIRYNFVPGPFMRVYVNAIRNSQQMIRICNLIEQADVMHMFPSFLDKLHDFITHPPIATDIRAVLF